MIIGIPSESKPHARVAGMTRAGSLPHRLATTGGQA
jgi:hypothetical protein